LGEVCKLLWWYAFSSSDFSDEWTQVIKMANVKEGFFDKNNKPSYVPNNFLKNHKKYSLWKWDILISMTWTIWKEDYWNICMVTDWDFLLNQRVWKFEADETKLNNNFLYYVCRQESFKRQVFSLSSWWVRQSNISWWSIEKINIPLPKLEEQRKIVSKIETEQSYVNGCKYLIKIFEKKIENKVSEIWGEKSLNV
jgi:restriction endonuclease S subunit